MPIRVRSQIRFSPRRGRGPVTAACAVIGAMGAVVSMLSPAGCDAGTAQNADNIVRTTTAVAGAEVVGVNRDTRAACALPSPPDTDVGPRRIDQPGDAVTVPADPRRIVVLDTVTLDATCALGLWGRVVGAGTQPGPRPQPRYLGTGINKIAGIGTIGMPDPAKIAALHPDLIIGHCAAHIAGPTRLQSIAPTVCLTPNSSWQQGFLDTARAMNRTEAGRAVLTAYRDHASRVGRTATPAIATQAQVSVLRFGADHSIEVLGRDSFAGQVLREIGVGRPGPQQGDSYRLDPSQLLEAEGDLIYVVFDGEEGKSYAQTVMHTDSWRDLGAATDGRVFVVEQPVWEGRAPTAANTLIGDVSSTLNSYEN